jgi:hypothetical protein
MAKFATAVVDALHSTFVAQMATEIAAVEADNGLAAGDITPIRKYYKYRAINEHVSPSIAVACVEFEFEDQPTLHTTQRCIVVLRYAGDADLEATELAVRRYATAMVNVIVNNNELGDSNVISSYIDNVSFAEVSLDGATFVDTIMDLSIGLEER